MIFLLGFAAVLWAGDKTFHFEELLLEWLPDGYAGIQDQRLREHPERKQHFRKDDPLMLPAVRRALDRPLQVHTMARLGASRRLAAAPLDPSEGGTPLSFEHESPGEVEGLVPEAQAGLALLYGAAKIATAEVEAAFAMLSEEERAEIRKTLPVWLERTAPEDKERFLKGEEDVESRKALLRCAELMRRVDRDRLDRAWATLRFGVQLALPGLRKQTVFEPKQHRIETPLGDILLYGSGKSGGTPDGLIVIDFGGDDELKTPEKFTYRPVRVYLDLGGNDLYIAQSAHGLASAICGVSLLVDVAGDDDYRGQDWSLGCALGGHALLWDMEGDDQYIGALGTQGVGIFGTGTLYDGGGHDEYQAGVFAQGFGSTGGEGRLIDRSGNDLYVAGRDEPDMWRRPGTWITFAQGSAYSHRFGHIWTDENKQRRWKMTGQLPGGVGLLIDGAGNDRYIADVFGQGSAYWFSYAALVDLGGDDIYRATWYGQGVGTHCAVGCLVDVAGNDRYYSRNTSQGCGHDFSAGILVDHAGNDRYRGVGLCQGAGNAASGIGLLLDKGGDDDYRCASNAWGFARPLEKTPELSPYGLFIDTGGKNSYSGDFAAKRTKGSWKQGKRGFGWDKGEK